MLVKNLLLVIAVISLIGCSATRTVKPSSIGPISIHPKVEVTTKPELLSGVSSLFTPYFESEKEKHKGYRLQLKDGGVDVGQIVLDQFRKGIAKHPVYSSKLADNGSNKFRISVPYHALVQQTTLSQKYAANVTIVVELLSPSGEVLFKSIEQSCIFTKCVTPYTLEQLKAKPELLKEQYKEASNDAVSGVLADL